MGDGDRRGTGRDTICTPLPGGCPAQSPAHPRFPPVHHHPTPNPALNRFTLKIVRILTFFHSLAATPGVGSGGRIRPPARRSAASIAAPPAPCPRIRAGAARPCQLGPPPCRAGVWCLVLGFFSCIFCLSATPRAVGLHCSSRAGAGRGSRSRFQPCPMLHHLPGPQNAPGSITPKSSRGSRGGPASHPPACSALSLYSNPGLEPAGSALGVRRGNLGRTSIRRPLPPWGKAPPLLLFSPLFSS